MRVRCEPRLAVDQIIEIKTSAQGSVLACSGIDNRGLPLSALRCAFRKRPAKICAGPRHPGFQIALSAQSRFATRLASRYLCISAASLAETTVGRTRSIKVKHTNGQSTLCWRTIEERLRLRSCSSFARARLHGPRDHESKRFGRLDSFQTPFQTRTVGRAAAMLSANNPFRDRTESSSPASRGSSSGQAPQLKSRNPFLDPSNAAAQSVAMSPEGDKVESRSRKARPDGASVARAPRNPASSRSLEAGNAGLRKETSTKAKSPEKGPGLSSSSTSKTRSNGTSRRKHLDKIDLLDVTGFNSVGGFHHDGPFDACNPARNKNTKRAPVLAFAKDSPSMSLSGGAPSQPVYFGDHVNNAESFADYGNNAAASPPKTRPDYSMRSASFDPAQSVAPIHGQESVGLGATTFLEGTPASYSAMMSRTISDTGTNNSGTDPRPRATSEYAGASGLGRKKSVIQRIRGAYRERAIEARAAEQSAAQTSSQSRPLQSSRVEETPDPVIGQPQMRSRAIDYKVSPQVRDAEATNDLMSPLYRPSSSGTSTSNGNPGGLIRRVKSLRVSRKT